MMNKLQLIQPPNGIGPENREAQLPLNVEARLRGLQDRISSLENTVLSLLNILGQDLEASASSSEASKEDR